MKVPWRRVAQAVVMLLALGFLVALLRGQWQTLQAYDWELRPGWALASLLLLGGAWLVQLGLWRSIVTALGGALPYGQAVRIWFLSNITRYIPGNVWQYLSMIELAAEFHISRLVTLTSVVLHQVISVAAGMALSALYFAGPNAELGTEAAEASTCRDHPELAADLGVAGELRLRLAGDGVWVRRVDQSHHPSRLVYRTLTPCCVCCQ